MKSMITMLLLASTLLAVRYPRFNAMYMVTFDMYNYTVQPENYRGESHLYIGEGYDSTTGEYCDFFAGDSCWYPLSIETTELEFEMDRCNLNQTFEYTFQNSPESESAIIIYRRNLVTGTEWFISSSTDDTILEDGNQVRSYHSSLSWHSDSMLSVGDRIRHTESFDEPALRYLGPFCNRRSYFVVTDIFQAFEPTVQVVRVPAKRVVEVETHRPLVDLLGRGSKLLSPGVFASPQTPVLRIRRGL